jgi:hypothetical protein
MTLTIPFPWRHLKIAANDSRKAIDDGEGGEHEGQDDYFDELT